MSTLKVNNVQVGQSNTATQNFTLTAAASDGTMKLARGNQGATTQDVLTVDASGNVDHPVGMKVGGLPAFACRAWVCFDATRNSSGGSDTANTNRFLIGAGGVSSVLKNADGDFTITFSNNLGTSFCWVQASAHVTGTSDGSVFGSRELSRTTNTLRIITTYANASVNGVHNSPAINVAVFA